MTPAALNIGWMPAAVPNETQWAGREVLGVILHDTEGSFQATIDLFQNPAALVSAHYVISQAGMIVQMVEDGEVAYHARGSWDLLPDCIKGRPDPVFCSRLNGYTIGIELELGKDAPDGGYSDVQYELLDALLARLTRLHPIQRTREFIKGHGELQADRRDPRGFDWARIGL